MRRGPLAAPAQPSPAAPTCPRCPARHRSAAAARRRGRRSPGSARRHGRTWHAPAPCSTAQHGAARIDRARLTLLTPQYPYPYPHPTLTGTQPCPAPVRPQRCPPAAPGAAGRRGRAGRRGPAAATWPRRAGLCRAGSACAGSASAGSARPRLRTAALRRPGAGGCVG